MEAEVQQLQAAVLVLQNGFVALQSENTQLRTQNAQLVAEIQELRATVSANQNRLMTSLAANQDQAIEIETLKQKIILLENQIQILLSGNVRLAATNQQQQEEMMNIKNLKKEMVPKALAELKRIQAELRKSNETAAQAAQSCQMAIGIVNSLAEEGYAVLSVNTRGNNRYRPDVLTNQENIDPNA